MGRADDRKKEKSIRKKLSDDQFKKLMNEMHSEYVKREVNAQMNFLQDNFLKAVVEALKKNGLSNIKCKAIVDDIESIFLKKVNKNGEA